MNKDIEDIIIFGSLVKGGIPQDIDIAILGTISRENKKKIREEIPEADIQIIGLKDIHKPIWLTLIKEGYSIKNKEYLHKIHNITPQNLYNYELTKLTATQKTQFTRGLKKIMEQGGEYLARSVVLVPLTLKNEMDEFLKKWNIYYETRSYELIPFQRKEF